MEIVEFKNTTWDILRSISDNMDKLFRPVGERYGLTMMQVRILLEVGGRTRTVGSLGKSISVAGGNISAMCKKLEKEAELKERLGGQRSLLSDVNSEE